jgi:hypothetical protein
MPVYYLGQIDTLLASRATGMLFVGEHKFSGSPELFLSGLTNDPQVAGYCWALEGVAQQVELPADIQQVVSARGGIRQVGGYLYGVTSSRYQYDPEPIKTGGLSRARNRTIPSWRYEEAVQRAGLAPATYAAHIDVLRRETDPRLYRREFGTVGTEERERFAHEIYAVAVEHARMRRDVWRSSSTPSAVATAFPRTPVCRSAGGWCAFRGPCAARTTDPAVLSQTFALSEGQRWWPEDGPPALPMPIHPTYEESRPCPF